MLSLLSAVCLRCPAASGGAISKISPFVFSYLDCAEPSVVSYAWEAALSVVSAHEVGVSLTQTVFFSTFFLPSIFLKGAL